MRSLFVNADTEARTPARPARHPKKGKVRAGPCADPCSSDSDPAEARLLSENSPPPPTRGEPARQFKRMVVIIDVCGPDFRRFAGARTAGRPSLQPSLDKARKTRLVASAQHLFALFVGAAGQ